MIFSKLRLHGFKSFVDGAEFLIEPGLTGIVGPNGCGKSNLVEALRWVMGENSYKNMRASGMDDVIFSGSGNRPARNIAEVSLAIDNSDRTAPAAFNSAELLEVTRRIERESGSVYRVNGREVRARDVQLLFADASSGARSPAMVRQGQIGEIIAAKPQARRRILEEAAGVAGLYSRRHEAELRLKGAEDNLVRLEDVLQQLLAQSDALKRQAEQAATYRELSADIRRLEALLLLLAHREAEAQLIKVQSQNASAKRDVEDRMMAQARAARDQAVAAANLPNLRDQEARAGAALQRLVLARQDLENQEKRANERMAELGRQILQIEHDKQRELALVADAEQVLKNIAVQRAEITDKESGHSSREADLREKLSAEEAATALADEVLARAQAELAQSQAQLAVFKANLIEESGREAKFAAELGRIEQEIQHLTATSPADGEAQKLDAALKQAQSARTIQEETLAAYEQNLAHLRQREGQERGPVQEAERKAQRLETEARTLAKLLNGPAERQGLALIDQIRVQKGFETALGAALGDDLEASLSSSAPVHWALITGDDPALSDGVLPLTQFVEAPAPLQRRLRQIGVCARVNGPKLRQNLAVGQRLVSVEGDLWRWDGFTQAANAPTPAARRLVEKNRLGELEIQAVEARNQADHLQKSAAALQAEIKLASEKEQAARAHLRELVREAERCRDVLNAFERAQAQLQARRSALDEARTRIGSSLAETRQKKQVAEAALAEVGLSDALVHAFEQARSAANAQRAQQLEARGQLNAFQQERNARARRLAELQREEASWRERQIGAADQAKEFDSRLTAAKAEQQQLNAAPDQFVRQRAALANEIGIAEQALREGSDARARGEMELSTADKAARAALDAMSAAREEAARLEARLEAAQVRLSETVAAIAESLSVTPEGLPALAGVTTNSEWPDARASERQLANLKAARERLGAVNLRAEMELAEVDTRRTNMMKERDDLTEAIRRLRLAIQSLNREGRQRLLAAFDQVNAHFKELFTTLFGGGAAELQLVESDDPLEAGLEILARPPGKKPQTMTLLSGGEQALTALSLIFAIFLTNPSPICVLDEVDAPLDDANVERFCDLLDEMNRRTKTRFLTITHNPITMARMNRLFGVTMAERGVSQLVSVDLETAERFAEAS